MYDWKQYVDVDSRVGVLFDKMVEGFPYQPEDRRGLRRLFEYGGWGWDTRIETHAPIYIYESKGQPVAWFSEQDLVGYVTGVAGAMPDPEYIG
jgi:hypothetical protein